MSESNNKGEMEVLITITPTSSLKVYNIDYFSYAFLSELHY